MTKALLVAKAASCADAAAIAAIEAATLARLGYGPEAERYEARADRLDSLGADYRRAAKLAH